VKQRPPAVAGSEFDTSNLVMGFRFDLVLGARPANVVTTYELFTPQSHVQSFTVYQTPNSTYGVPTVGQVLLDPAFITTRFTVPSPGALCLFATGVLLWRRNR
jgi:hypothetical protein